MRILHADKPVQLAIKYQYIVTTYKNKKNLLNLYNVVSLPI